MGTATTMSALMAKTAALFHMMGIAEEELDAAKARHPAKRAELHASWGILCPPGSLRLMSPKVFRSHAGELLERVAAGADTRPGTDAEVLAAMSQASLVAPPSELWAHLMERLFNAVMGPHVFIVDASMPRELYPGAADELRAELGRKTAVSDRVVSP